MHPRRTPKQATINQRTEEKHAWVPSRRHFWHRSGKVPVLSSVPNDCGNCRPERHLYVDAGSLELAEADAGAGGGEASRHPQSSKSLAPEMMLLELVARNHNALVPRHIDQNRALHQRLAILVFEKNQRTVFPRRYIAGHLPAIGDQSLDAQRLLGGCRTGIKRRGQQHTGNYRQAPIVEAFVVSEHHGLGERTVIEAERITP